MRVNWKVNFTLKWVSFFPEWWEILFIQFQLLKRFFMTKFPQFFNLLLLLKGNSQRKKNIDLGTQSQLPAGINLPCNDRTLRCSATSPTPQAPFSKTPTHKRSKPDRNAQQRYIRTGCNENKTAEVWVELPNSWKTLTSNK